MISTETRQISILAGALLAQTTPAMGYLLRNVQSPCSHLSPLLRYEPADAWTHTLDMSYSDEPGASISFRQWGNQWGFRGDPPSAGMINTAEPAFEEVPSPSWYPTVEYRTTYDNGTMQRSAQFPGSLAYGSTLQWRDVRAAAAENFSSDATEEERRIAVSSYSWALPLPIDQAFADSVTDRGFP